MNKCQNCGQLNDGSSNFCRFCGTRMIQTAAQSYEYNPPRPYVWKTDEYQTSQSQNKSARQINQVQPLTNQPPSAPMQMYNYRGSQISYGYRCPNCGTQNFPRIERKISTAGWIIFALLLVFVFPLFWIGFLIREDVKVCPVCNVRLS